MSIEVTNWFQYKGLVYSFSNLGNTPLNIEATLKAIDEGKVPSLPGYEELERAYDELQRAHQFLPAKRNQCQLSNLRFMTIYLGRIFLVFKRIESTRRPPIVESRIEWCVKRDFKDKMFHELNVTLEVMR